MIKHNLYYSLIKHIFGVGLIVISISLTACQIVKVQTTTTSPTPAMDTIVAQVNQQTITLAQLETSLAVDRALYYLTTGQDLLKQDPSAKLEWLATSYLIDQQAQQADITVSDQVIMNTLAQNLQERNATLDQLEKALSQQGVNLDNYKDNIARTLRAEKYINEVILQTNPTDPLAQERLATWLKDIQTNANIDIIYQPATTAPIIGGLAPDFTLTNLKGESISLSQFKGQPVIINFWATWCIPCLKEMPVLQTAFEAHKNDGLIILGINRAETEDLVKPFISESEITFEILYDVEAGVNQTYLVSGLPRTIFINRQGIIKNIHIGELQETLLQGYIDNLLREKES